MIAVGCTGGKHRSVCIAKELFEFVSIGATRLRSATATWAEGERYDGFLQEQIRLYEPQAQPRTIGFVRHAAAKKEGASYEGYHRDRDKSRTTATAPVCSGEDTWNARRAISVTALWRLPIRSFHHAAAAQLPLYRGEPAGQSFGNLFLAAMNGISGSF